MMRLQAFLARGRRAVALAGIWLLGSCGGGVDSGGTGSPTYASGPISGFGSVIVNGIHFDDSSARVTDTDGNLHSRDELRLGMTTEIRASATTSDAAGTPISTASSIAFGVDLLGPLDSIDSTRTQLVVLGQTVVVNAATVFDGDSLPGGAAALAVGNVVQVYALLDAATNRYTATRIERAGSGVAFFRLRGAIANLDTAARRFDVGATHFSYAALETTPPPLANGAIVRLRLATAPSNGVWPVQAVSDGVQRPDDRDDARIEGVISAFSSVAQFSVAGVAVDASRAANLPAGLALGARVDIRGTQSGTTLVASDVQVKSEQEVDDQDFEVSGSIVTIDPTQSRFVVRGVTVNWSVAGTEFRNGTSANLTPGVSVEARGRLSADGTELAATRITFR